MEEARQGMVPASDLTAAQSSLSTVERRIADLERELKEEKAKATLADERAQAAVVAAAEERKMLDALVPGLQDDLSGLQDFITDHYRPLIGEFFVPWRVPEH